MSEKSVAIENFLAAHPRSWFSHKQLVEACGLTPDYNLFTFAASRQGIVRVDKTKPRQHLYQWVGGKRIRSAPKPKGEVVSTNGHMQLGERVTVIGLVQMPGEQGVTVMVLRADGTVKELSLT